MKVKDFVMLLMAEQIAYIRRTKILSLEEAYNRTLPIARIYCNDGTSFSAQCHHSAFCSFADVPPNESEFSQNFGKQLLEIEVDFEERFDSFTDIEYVEEYAAKHGGIDFERTSLEAVQRVLC